MFISAMLGTAATTRYLLDHGADPTIAGSKGSALHGAVMAGMTLPLLHTDTDTVDHFRTQNRAVRFSILSIGSVFS